VREKQLALKREGNPLFSVIEPDVNASDYPWLKRPGEDANYYFIAPIEWKELERSLKRQRARIRDSFHGGGCSIGYSGYALAQRELTLICLRYGMPYDLERIFEVQTFFLGKDSLTPSPFPLIPFVVEHDQLDEDIDHDGTYRSPTLEGSGTDGSGALDDQVWGQVSIVRGTYMTRQTIRAHLQTARNDLERFPKQEGTFLPYRRRAL
jgi:hypothetical protein